jgi:hypothetical protein
VPHRLLIECRQRAVPGHRLNRCDRMPLTSALG